MYNLHAFLVDATKYSILALLLVSFTALSVNAEPSVINVATIERPPFVMKRGTGHIGYSIELWDAIAKEVNLNYDLKVYETFPEMMDSVENKENDLAVANITITSERERHFDFSHPIFLSGLQIMLSKNRPSGFMSTFNAILKSGVLKVIGGAFLILLIVAHLIWIFEWGDDKDFDDRYAKGIWDSLWWAVVTVTTVGYGDQVPRTILGRILALIWMFFSLFLLSVLVAQISSSIINATFDGSIAGPEDLVGHRVATIAGSTSEVYLNKIGASVVGFESTEEMFKALRSNRADAVVFDAPVLSYFAAHDTDNMVKLVGRVFKPEQFGIALQVDSPYRDQINRALLKLSEDGKVQQIYDDWFSK